MLSNEGQQLPTIRYMTDDNNQLAMLGSNQSGSSISTNESFMHIAHSRVMSPTQANLQVLYDSNIGLLGIRGVMCQLCRLMADDPVICAHCGNTDMRHAFV